MNEIKFRQEHLLKGKFHDWHYWGYTEGDNNKTFIGPLPPNMGGKSYQYIGSVSKNGLEIYEGMKTSEGGVIIWNQEEHYYCILNKRKEIESLGKTDYWIIIVDEIE